VGNFPKKIVENPTDYPKEKRVDNTSGLTRTTKKGRKKEKIGTPSNRAEVEQGRTIDFGLRGQFIGFDVQFGGKCLGEG